MPIFNLQSFINIIKSIITNDLLPDLCYLSSHCPEKNHASAQEKSGFQEAFRSQEALEGAAGFRGGGGPCFTALAL